MATSSRPAVVFGVVLVSLTEVVLAVLIAGMFAIAVHGCARVPEARPVVDARDPAPRCIPANGCDDPEGDR